MNGTDEMLGIAWFGRAGRQSKADLTVTVALASKQTGVKNICFTFRNGKWENFGDYVQVGIRNDTLVFKKSDSFKGISLANNKSTTNDNRYAKISCQQDVPYFLNFEGDYDLKHEKKFDIWYAEKRD